MRPIQAVAFLIIVLSVACTSAFAQPLVSGEGVVEGTVYATGSYGEYIPLYWVTVTASNGKYNFTTSTDDNGFYVLFIPPGNYTVTAQASFQSKSANVTVTSGSARFLNFDFTWRTHYTITP
jgi:hypothetical protein